MVRSRLVPDAKRITWLMLSCGKVLVFGLRRHAQTCPTLSNTEDQHEKQITDLNNLSLGQSRALICHPSIIWKLRTQTFFRLSLFDQDQMRLVGSVRSSKHQRRNEIKESLDGVSHPGYTRTTVNCVSVLLQLPKTRLSHHCCCYRPR